MTIVGGHPRREIRCESNLEANAVYVFLADRDIVDILEQPPAIAYLDQDGERRRHTFDFLLTHRSGERILVAIKPAARARAKNFRAQLRQIAACVPRATAQKVVLITDIDLGRDRVHDAKLIWTARRTLDPEADAAVVACASHLTGAVTVRDLVRMTGLHGRAFLAIIRAIANGNLTREGPRIEYETFVRAALATTRSHDASSNTPVEEKP